VADATQQLAESLRAAITEGGVERALAAHLADPVSVHHDPAMPTDGPITRAAFSQILTGNPMAAALPDGRRSYGTLSVDGDEISFDSVLSGVSRTGESLRIENRTVLTVAQGKIVKLVQRYEPSAMATLAKLFAQPADH
jgi:ketosteroid isomerase-like protein